MDLNTEPRVTRKGETFRTVNSFWAHIFKIKKIYYLFFRTKVSLMTPFAQSFTSGSWTSTSSSGKII